jgi:CBS domain-containing protein
MKVADLMTRDVITVGPEATLREVASVLATEHIGGVPVVTNESILGVVSATDLVDFDAESPGAPVRKELQGEGFGEVLEEPAWEVEAGEQAVGDYFTGFWEDAGVEVAERFENVGSPEWNVLDEHVASEVMTRAVFSVTPETDVEEAARRMLEADVHRALVLEDDRLVGMLTSQDILRAVAEVGLPR